MEGTNMRSCCSSLNATNGGDKSATTQSQGEY